MDLQITVRALADLGQAEGLIPEKEYFLTYYRAELLRTLREEGFAHVEIAEAPAPHQPDITATRDGHRLCICLPPVPPSAMDLQALSAEQCLYCEQQLPRHDVYFAALLVNPQERRLYLLCPVPVRTDGSWQSREPEQAQFLPLSRRAGADRYSPIFGGAAFFKLSRMLIPHVMQHGRLPRFSVRGAFHEQEQGGNGLYALMGSAPPSFMMLAQRGATTGSAEFLRPFFFYGERPRAELELTRCTEQQAGLVELLDKTGRLLWAECLEQTLFPTLLPTGKHYKWTLSLVADRCKPLQREFSLSAGALHEQARRDYRRIRGEEAPQDFAVRVSTGDLRSLLQAPQQSYSELCGRVTHTEELEIDTGKVLMLSILPLADNDDVEVQVFVGAGVELSRHPQPGEVVECAGFLYASPDAVVDGAESWQDSGVVAAQQEKRRLEQNTLRAYERYSGYSLAYGVVAAAFARAGYSLLDGPKSHTREDATFVVQNDEGEKLMLFVDAFVSSSGHEPQFAYTEEQRTGICIRERSTYGAELTAVHCPVSLKREPNSESYAVQLLLDPACPAVLPENIISDATQCPLPGTLTEEQACRVICNAICSQEWGEFARLAAEDMTYASRVNGTSTCGKLEYIRYMAERKQLWEEQMGWPGMRMETGTLTYKGQKRPCFMIHCYGRRIGAAVVTLRNNLIADMETVELEVNASYEPDAACSAPRSIYHPLQGQLIPFTTRQSPLQRFTAAYLQECMVRKTSFISPSGGTSPSPAPTPAHPGVEFSLRKQNARWLKLVRNGPSFCDLAFACGGRVYAVCALETERHPARGEDVAHCLAELPERELLLQMCERYGMVPCLFPAKRGYTPDPRSTWNLWDARTLQPLHPELQPDTAPAAPSAWEVLNAALSELVNLVQRSGGRTLACHDVPDLLPHFWFYNADGELCWVIVRPHTQGTHTDSAPGAAERRALQLTPGTQGYVMDVEAWGDTAHTTPAHSGAPLYLHLSEPQPLQEH